MKTSEEFKPFDVTEYLGTAEDRAAYLRAMWDDSGGDPTIVATALGDVARALGMSQIARDTGVAREALYKALSARGNPELATVMKVLRALGLELSVRPLDDDDNDAGKQLRAAIFGSESSSKVRGAVVQRDSARRGRVSPHTTSHAAAVSASKLLAGAAAKRTLAASTLTQPKKLRAASGSAHGASKSSRPGQGKKR